MSVNRFVETKKMSLLNSLWGNIMKLFLFCFLSFWMFLPFNFFGQTWIPLYGPPGYNISILKSDKVGNIFIGNHSYSTFRMKSYGQDSWDILGEDLEIGTIKNIEISRSNIFVHHENWFNSLFKYSKTDLNKEKIELDEFHSFTLFKDSILVVASSYTNFDFFISNDEGENWDTLDFNLNRSFPTIYSSGELLYLTCNEETFDLENILVYFSADSAATWQLMPQFKDYIYSFELDAQYYYCSSDSLSIFTSSDSSWSSLTQALLGKITACAFNKSSGIFVSTEHGVIYFSDDKGSTWSNINFFDTRSLTATSDGRLFAAASDGAVISFGGENFLPNFENPKLFMVHSSLFTDRKFSLILSQNSHGLYLSDDKGNTWMTSYYDDEQIKSLFATNDGQYYISTDHSIHTSIDMGIHWEQILHKAGSSLKMFSDCYDNIYYSSGSVLYRSADKGEEWETVISSGINVDDFFSGYNNEFTIFEEDYTNPKIGKSVDSGKTWIVSDLENNLAITSGVLLSNGNFVIYRDEGGDDSRILKSSDGGYVWEEVFYSGDKFVNLISINDIIYSGYKRFGATYSENEGKSWKNMGSDGLTNKYTHSFIIDSDGYFYISAYDGMWEPFNGGVFRSSLPLVTSIEEIEEQMTNKFHLSQNYPNPFNPSTVIKYQIPNKVIPSGVEEALVQLIIYDILGKEVVTLVNKKQGAGNYQVEFNASNLPSGVYFYRLSTDSFVETKKMVLLR